MSPVDNVQAVRFSVTKWSIFCRRDLIGSMHCLIKQEIWPNEDGELVDE